MFERLVDPFRRRPLVADGLVASVLFALALALNDVGYETGPVYPWASLPRYSVAVAALGLTMLPIAVRRRLPFTALLTGATGLALLRLLHVPEYQLSSIALFFLIYSAGRWGRPGWRDGVRALAALMMLSVLGVGLIEERRFLNEGLLSERAYVVANIVGILGNLVFIVAPWLLGNSARARADRESELATANEALVASRAEAERRAVSDERVRIARELHDVVAHHVSVMGVQAAAARRTIERSPAQAAAALTDIEESSREAVSELHRLLGFLRQPAGEPSDVGVVDLPAPSLSQLPGLQRQTAAAGLAVSLSIEGDRPAHLPASIDLSAYRIVQEALTNALKHSGQQEAEVVVRYRPGAVSVHVTDRGVGQQVSTPARGGNGLIGMQERVALHGGSLRFGDAPDGGFEVIAELPLDGTPKQLEMQQ